MSRRSESATSTSRPSTSTAEQQAREQQKPLDRDRIDWKLITNLAVGSLDQAIEKVQWYALRWKIGVFHKILKSGCRAEQSPLRTTARLTNLLAVFSILAWRVFWLTMTHRLAPEARPGLVFTLAHYLTKLARLGGYLARNSDPPPEAKLWLTGRRIRGGRRAGDRLLPGCCSAPARRAACRPSVPPGGVR